MKQEKHSFLEGTLGLELMKRVKEWAKDEDVELLIVYPSEEAVEYYERAGFRAERRCDGVEVAGVLLAYHAKSRQLEIARRHIP